MTIECCPKCGVPGKPHTDIEQCADALIIYHAGTEIEYPVRLTECEIRALARSAELLADLATGAAWLFPAVPSNLATAQMKLETVMAQERIEQ